MRSRGDDVAGPAEAGAHFRDEVVVAHEELAIVHVVYVVRVHDATLESAREREALVGGADVGAARVERAELGLREHGARAAAVLVRSDDVARALLARTEKARAR